MKLIEHIINKKIGGCSDTGYFPSSDKVIGFTNNQHPMFAITIEELFTRNEILGISRRETYEVCIAKGVQIDRSTIERACRNIVNTAIGTEIVLGFDWTQPSSNEIISVRCNSYDVLDVDQLQEKVRRGLITLPTKVKLGVYITLKDEMDMSNLEAEVLEFIYEKKKRGWDIKDGSETLKPFTEYTIDQLLDYEYGKEIENDG